MKDEKRNIFFINKILSFSFLLSSRLVSQSPRRCLHTCHKVGEGGGGGGDQGLLLRLLHVNTWPACSVLSLVPA